GDLATVRFAQTLDDLQCGGLAGPVRAQDPEELALFYLEGHAVHGEYLAVRLAQLTHRDRGRHARHNNRKRGAGLGGEPPWDPRWPKAAFLRHGALAGLAGGGDPRPPGVLGPRSSRALAVLAGGPRNFRVAFGGRGPGGRHGALLAGGGNRLGTRRWH